MRFTVLASGSGGNASLVESAGFGVLIDVGLGPRQISSRLARVGLSWTAVNAVLLSHTHTDHWKDTTFFHLHRHRVPLWCHAGHHTALRTYSDGFIALHENGLVRSFEARQDFELWPGLNCRALPLRHDSGATFGFRLEAAPDMLGQRNVIGYVADLGCWDEELASQLADVDLLALEFNHDVAMQHASGRTARLIQRVLGDEGHLSNAQAVDFLRAILSRSTAGRLRHLVQLHLSRECNRPALARAEAQRLLEDLGIELSLHTAEQHEPGATVHLNSITPASRTRRVTAKRNGCEQPSTQQLLPGLEDILDAEC